MGWGQEPHEGWADEKLPDGRWLGPTRRGEPDPVALRATCSCGWHSEREHAVPPRPDHPKDERGMGFGPEYDAWIAALEAASDACWDDWTAEHFDPMLGYEPSTQLILGRSAGGPRHFLNGHPVHAGASLELLLDDGTWLPIRYEWSWDPDKAPTAYAALGVPVAATTIVDRPLVEFALPPRAILRWPEQKPVSDPQPLP